VIPGDVFVWAAVALAVAAGLGAPRRPANLLLVGAAVGLTIALARLAFGFATEEWALDYVAAHTRVGLGGSIRIAGLWAGPEGSLLLWTTMVAWVVVAATAGGPLGVLRSAARSVWGVRFGAGLVVAYGLLVAVVASPFDRSDVPAVRGVGLQPVLEHPAMVWHPPIIYAGLVGLLVPLICAAAAMLAGDVEGGLGRRVPVSLAVSMALLTVGLATGARWAGVELGWGGYWAWDPIESAGLVAWLCAAAGIHAVGWRRPAIRSEPMLAALLVAPGVAAVWATTLTRIGLVASVHAFADRPSLRMGLLTVAWLVTGTMIAAIFLGARVVDRAPGQVARRAADRVPGRVAQRAAVGVLAVAALVVAIGAYEPLAEAATSGDAVAIAGRYYTRLLWPVAIVGTALAVRADRRWWWAVAGAVGGVLAVPVAAGPFALALGAGGGATTASAIGAWRGDGAGGARRAGVVAHVGVGLVLVGVAGTVATTGTTATLRTGETQTVDGMTITHRSVELIDGEATSEAVATVDIDGVTYRPSLVSYELRGVSTAETASRTTGLDELQVRLVDGTDQAARYRITRLPRVGLVWLGSALVALGALGQVFRRLRANSSDSVDGSPSAKPADRADSTDASGSSDAPAESAPPA
jgi:cytochrome c-type biogenesis protein CcmF